MTAIRISPDQERIIDGIAWGIALYTVALGIAGLALGMSFMGGVLVGGSLTYFNFIWFASIIRGVVTGRSTPQSFAAKTVAKALLLYAMVGVLVGFGLVDAIGFLVGLTGLFMGVIIGSLRWHIQRPDDE